jgi:hypothetical protein
MRTTVRIDDDLLLEIKKRSEREGTPITKLINDALRDGLSAKPVKRPPYREKVFSMGQPLFNVDKALSFAADDEDAEILRKLALRK